MNRDQFIRMAEEAGFKGWSNSGHQALERFAAFIADAEAKRIYDEGMVTVGHMREQIAAAIEQERKEFADHSVEFARIAVEKAMTAEREKVLKEFQHAKNNEANI